MHSLLSLEKIINICILNLYFIAICIMKVLLIIQRMNMKTWEGLSYLQNTLLINVGFSWREIRWIIYFDGAPWPNDLRAREDTMQMYYWAQLKPFYSCTRLLIECKDHRKKVGLNMIRSVWVWILIILTL